MTFAFCARLINAYCQQLIVFGTINNICDVQKIILHEYGDHCSVLTKQDRTVYHLITGTNRFMMYSSIISQALNQCNHIAMV